MSAISTSLADEFFSRHEKLIYIAPPRGSGGST
jgi:hypothetical protein